MFAVVGLERVLLGQPVSSGRPFLAISIYHTFILVVNLESHVPAAVVEFGFSSEEKITFRRIAQQIHTVKRKNTQMIEPVLKCNVEYLEITDNGALRICTFRGFAV
jgi:hypothetical protein